MERSRGENEGLGRRLRPRKAGSPGRAGGTKSGWETARTQSKGSEVRCEHGLLPGGSGATAAVTSSHIVTLLSAHLEMSHSAVSRHEQRDWGTAAVRHKYISAPSDHRKHTISTETAKPGKLFDKICRDHYFWEEKIWLGLSWLLGTWVEYTLENAELCLWNWNQ